MEQSDSLTICCDHTTLPGVGNLYRNYTTLTSSRPTM